MLDIDKEFTVYEENEIKITGILDEDDLWLFIGPVTKWSVSTYKRWVNAIADILDAASDHKIKRLVVYTKTPQSYKFARMLGFQEVGTIKEATIMAQEV